MRNATPVPQRNLFSICNTFFCKKKKGATTLHTYLHGGADGKKKNIYESVLKCKHMLLMLAEVKVLDNCVRTKKTRDGRQRHKYQI